jgi:hypothetical protein
MQQISLLPIREAISSGEFERARLLWDSSVTGLVEEFEHGGCTEARLAEIRELVEWSRTVFLCERVRLQDQIRRQTAEIQVESGYQCGAAALAPTTVAARF